MKRNNAPPGISVILIVRNEAAQIRDCLESVMWADEIVVVDGGSQDETVAICREYTAFVYAEPQWLGFGVQKNRALAHARCAWVFSLDADERVSPELAAEIRAAITQPFDGWQISRLSSYCGRFMYHGDWGKDNVLRLFRRGSATFTNDIVHERVQLNPGCRMGKLHNHLLHYSIPNLERVLDKLNHYSTQGATMRWAHDKTRRVGLGTALLHGLWTFVRGYVLRLGFLDGREGFMLAVSNAEGVYYRYLKWMYLQPPPTTQAAKTRSVWKSNN